VVTPEFLVQQGFGLGRRDLTALRQDYDVVDLSNFRGMGSAPPKNPTASLDKLLFPVNTIQDDRPPNAGDIYPFIQTTNGADDRAWGVSPKMLATSMD